MYTEPTYCAWFYDKSHSEDKLVDFWISKTCGRVWILWRGSQHIKIRAPNIKKMGQVIIDTWLLSLYNVTRIKFSYSLFFFLGGGWGRKLHKSYLVIDNLVTPRGPFKFYFPTTKSSSPHSLVKFRLTVIKKS